MKFGIYNSYWEKDWGGDLIPYVDRVAKLGFDLLEVSFANAVSTPDSHFIELKKAAEDAGIALTAGYGPPKKFNCTSDDKSEVEAGVVNLERTFEKMALADIHFVGGGLYSYWPVDYADPIDKPRDWDRSVIQMKRVAKIAQNHGVTLGMEVLNRFEGYLINTAAECRQFITEVGEKNVGIMLDTFHMNIEEDNLCEAIKVAGDMLIHLHVGEANRRLPCANGLPWEDIGAALRSVGFDQCIVMEPFVRMGGQIGADIKVWRDLSNGATDAQLDEEAAKSVKYLRKVFEG